MSESFVKPVSMMVFLRRNGWDKNTALRICQAYTDGGVAGAVKSLASPHAQKAIREQLIAWEKS